MSSRTKWVLGSILLLTVPFYKRILKIGDRVEKTAENMVEIVEKVAEETEKIGSDVAGALPDGNLKQEALEVEKFAEEVDNDAKIVEVFLHKVDKIKEELEELVEPNIEKQVKNETTIPNADLPENHSNTEK
ncbi:hypothetical protein J5N97_002977 [Dioscorea zingiberensis]|uniref:Uncharacterized protein n=1 Tax=Dioscorea zingiberensis TaxID=325984 RepID=A0A9D5D3B6_9LILI|nr:hypothetical protein J5N97_002977 [Dioscorea zingiberensis]